MTLEEIKQYLVKAELQMCPEKLKSIKERAIRQTENLLNAHLEGEKTKKSHKKSHGKISFQKLAQVIGQRWRDLSKEEKKRYYVLSEKDKQRFLAQVGGGGGDGSSAMDGSLRSSSSAGRGGFDDDHDDEDGSRDDEGEEDDSRDDVAGGRGFYMDTTTGR
jgi:hypothetical protein